MVYLVNDKTESSGETTVLRSVGRVEGCVEIVPVRVQIMGQIDKNTWIYATVCNQIIIK